MHVAEPITYGKGKRAVYMVDRLLDRHWWQLEKQFRKAFTCIVCTAISCWQVTKVLTLF